jgi:thioredoxin 1
MMPYNMSEMQKMVAVAIVRVVAVDNQDKSKKRNLALKIIIPIVVVAIIAGIWFFKANQEKQEFADINTVVTTTDVSQETVDSGSPITTIGEPKETTGSSSSETTTAEAQQTANADFLLAATKIDLDKLKLYSLPIIIDFGADSCIPCKEMAPVLKKLNQEWQGKVIVKFIDVWKYPDAAADFPLQVIPTQFFFDAQGNPYVPSDPEAMQMYMLKDTGGEHVYTAHVGGITEAQLRAALEEMGIK